MRDENTEKIRERILSFIDSEFQSDVAFEREMSLAPKTVNNWRRGLSASYMKILPELSEKLKINVGELLDLPLKGKSSELSDDEIHLLTLYRRTRTLPRAMRTALSESLDSVINMYIVAGSELKESKKRLKISRTEG